MQVKHIWTSPDAEKLIAYCARVSSANQENPNYEALLRYCIRNRHWSIFEMAAMCIEITTSRAISAQILRHRSFHFQEFSQRYAPVQSFEQIQLREQDSTNRQNSTDTLSDDLKENLNDIIQDAMAHTMHVYEQLLGAGVAKESARMLLPMAATTKLYMQGTVRDWIHYINLRTGEGTQDEHKKIANSIKKIFIKEFPTISTAFDWYIDDSS